jgi:Bacterial lectin/PEP-CTERM motif
MNPLRSTLTSLALAGGLLAGTAQADQGVDFGLTFTDFTTWNTFGSASANTFAPGNGFLYSLLTLTETGSGGQAGSGFAPEALTLDFNQGFRFAFNWFIPVYDGIGLRGDGMTFVLAAAPGGGSGGSDLGYGGLPGASLAFAIDTFNFDDEPASPSIQLLSGGSTTPIAVTETGLGDSIRNPDWQWFADLVYTPSGDDNNTGTLVGSITHLDLGGFSVQAEVDFSSFGLAGVPVYYGFTAGNGAAIDGHIVTSAMAIPEPGTWALMLAGVSVLGFLTRRRTRR